MKPHIHSGRANTVLVFRQGREPIAVCTQVIAKIQASDSFLLEITGSVSPAVIAHYDAVLLPLVRELCESLGKTGAHVCIEFIPLDALNVLEISMQVSGHSADLPVLSAVVSALLGIPCRSDVLLSGAIVSGAGDIGAVQDLPAKIDSFLSDRTFSLMVCPHKDGDGSMEKLLPKEHIQARAARRQVVFNKRIAGVSHINQLWLYAFDEGEVLERAYAVAGFAGIHDLPGWIFPLVKNIDTRFWIEWCQRLHESRIGDARLLLDERIRFHLTEGVYPVGFAESLASVLRSLPVAVKLLTGFEILISGEQLIALKALSDRCGVLDSHLDVLPDAFQHDSADQEISAEQSFGILTERLSEEHLVSVIDTPIDDARVSYPLDSITIKSRIAFWQEITVFLEHVHRTRNGTPGAHSDSMMDGTALVDEAFVEHGGVSYALNLALSGQNGGMGTILDVLTNALKCSARQSYLDSLIKRLWKAQDFDFQLRLTEMLMDHFSSELSEAVRTTPPAHYARHFDKLLAALMQERTQFNRHFYAH